MRVAYNARILTAPRTGIGQYLVELIKALMQHSDVTPLLFTGKDWRTDIPSAAMQGYANKATLIKRWVPGAYTLRRYREQYHFGRGIEKYKPDLYHDPSLWPLDFRGPAVMTVHDLTHLEYPETQPADRIREIEKRFPSSLERVAHIMVDSTFIAHELQRHYGIDSTRITVAPLGHAERFKPHTDERLKTFLTPLGLSAGRYVLCVGTLEPRKNIPLALKAHALLPADQRKQYPLVIAGVAGWNFSALHRDLEAAVKQGHVRLLGYQEDDTLAALTAGARMMLFPSRYEGFGLPVLEAMASGTPVMLTRQSAMPEVAGDAGIYAPPDDPEAWCEIMQNLLEDNTMLNLHRTLGLQRAQLFSWRHCAELTANVYRQVLNH